MVDQCWEELFAKSRRPEKKLLVLRPSTLPPLLTGAQKKLKLETPGMTAVSQARLVAVRFPLLVDDLTEARDSL